MTDIEAINELLESFVAAFNEGNAAECVSLLADDAVSMPPNAPALHGRQAYGAWLEELQRSYGIEEVISAHETEIAGDWAFDRGHWEATVTDKSSGETSEDEGDYVWILKKSADGAWQPARLIWNNDKPPA